MSLPILRLEAFEICLIFVKYEGQSKLLTQHFNVYKMLRKSIAL